MNEERLILLRSASKIGALIGVCTGVGLSFTALSPLVICGIIGSIAPALLIALCAGSLLYKFCKKDSIEKDEKYGLIRLGITTLASAAIGVGLAAAVIAIFPGAMLGIGPAFLTSVVIASIAPAAAFFAMEYIMRPIAEKVNEYVISPVVEHLSSKKNEYQST